MQIPENLGQIEFLREHPQILEKLIERSRDKSLEPFIKNLDATSGYGGFYWSQSEEGYDVWESVMSGDFEPFYEIYPRIEQPKTEPSTDIAQIRYHMEQIEALLKKMEVQTNKLN